MTLTIATSSASGCRGPLQDYDAFPLLPRTNSRTWMRWAAIVLVAAVLALGRDGVADEPAGKARLTTPPVKLRLRDSAPSIRQASNVEPQVSESTVPPAPINQPLTEPNPATDRYWTLEALESLALQHNPTLPQAAAAVDADRGIYDQVGRYPNPQVGYLRSDSSGSGSQSQGVFVSQEFVTAGKLKKNRDIEAWDMQRLSWDAEAQRMRVLNDVKIRYYELLVRSRPSHSPTTWIGSPPTGTN